VIDPADATDAQRAALAEWRADRAVTHVPASLWRMLVASPESMRAVGKLGAHVRVGLTIDLPFKTVVAAVASRQRGYTYEIGIQEDRLASAGIDPVAVHGVATGSGADTLPPGVAAAARLAGAMAAGERPRADDVTTLRELLGDAGFVQLIVSAAYFLMLGDIAGVLQPSAG
jgi:hypothetical protein